MRSIRRSARAIAIVWLTCQAASLSAFVPENCCISHAAEAAAKEKNDACHETEPVEPEPGDACPMTHAEGAACPMHSSKSQDCCAMSNACDGPGTHLANLFAYLGAIERPATSPVVLDSTPSVLRPSSSPLFRELTPDAPPPKA